VEHKLTVVKSSKSSRNPGAGVTRRQRTPSHFLQDLQNSRGNGAVLRLIQASPNLRSAQCSEWELLDNPIWNMITSDALGAATGLFEAANPGKINMPTLQNALVNAAGVKGWDVALAMEDALSAPASKLPGVFGPSASIVGSRLPKTMSRASAVLAPLGVVSSAQDLHEAVTRRNDQPGNSGLERSGDALAATAGLFSSSVGTGALAGAGLNAVGATAAGGALSTGMAALSSAAALAGAGAGGYELGQLGDKAIGYLANVTGASDAIDKARGIRRNAGEHGDYSLSGIGAASATALDRTVTSGLRSVGVLDERKPEYTQTLGWQLAELLPSWLL
jgi:hypothetical protein